jgi:FAD/FMN-containing dehydrogenase
MAWVCPKKLLSPRLRCGVRTLTALSAADHALSFDILTASGDFVTANAACNPDLFWALKGGGPSTFGIVLSVTVKTFPEVPSASIILNINSTHTNDTSLFYKGVAALHDLANHWVDHGMFAFFELSSNRLHVQPLVGPNMTAAQIEEIAKPMFDRLDAEGVPYSTSVKEFATFFDLYIDIFEDELAGSLDTYRWEALHKT